MHRDRRAVLAAGVAGVLSLPFGRTGRAQGGGDAWSPERPIRFIVPFPPGGATDIWARMVGDAMGAELGQPIVIENRSGAGGMVGTEAAAKAAPDGHTLLFTISPFIQSPVVFRRWPYQPLEDFAPIGKLGTTPLPFCIRPEIPARTLAEFVSYARGKDLSFGSYAAGSTGHAYAQLLSDQREARDDAHRLSRRGADAHRHPGRAHPVRLPQHDGVRASTSGADGCGRWPAPGATASLRCRRCRPSFRSATRRPSQRPASSGCSRRRGCRRRRRSGSRMSSPA